MSRRLVIKFGGTSLATPKRLKRAARRIAAQRAAGFEVVVVVSARGRTTDRLLRSVARVGGAAIQRAGPSREADRLLSTGEERSAALLAVALWSLGVQARSLRGGEAGVRSHGGFGRGRIVEVDPAPLRCWLERGSVPVVAGFQGERADGETVTLGRGGSDTTAVAIAAALAADCHIVTDVEAVFDRDPALDPLARPFRELDHDALVALAEGGARVIHLEAARRARHDRVPLWIYHHTAADERSGTRVGEATCARC